jgi:hypothetical protein
MYGANRRNQMPKKNGKKKKKKKRTPTHDTSDNYDTDGPRKKTLNESDSSYVHVRSIHHILIIPRPVLSADAIIPPPPPTPLISARSRRFRNRRRRARAPF